MKRKIIYLIFILSFAVFLYSCNEEPTHVHNYIMTTVEPDCVGDGYDLYSCECGDQYQENFVRSKGHNYSEYLYDDENFVKYQECIICKVKTGTSDYQINDYERIYDFEYKLDENKKLMCYVKNKGTDNIVHSYEGEIISDVVLQEATCMTEGQYIIWAEFIILDDIKVGQSFIYNTPKVEHKLGDWNVQSPADCEFPGQNYRECEFYCGYREYEDTESLNGHKYTVTTTRENNILHFKAVCENNSNHNVEKDFELNVNDTEPTCTSVGIIKYTLSAWDINYGDIIYEEVVEYGEVKDHNLHYEVITKPTNTNDGMVRIACHNCSKVDYYNLAKLDSSDYKTTVVNELSCTENGLIKYELKIEGLDIEFEIPTLSRGHNLENGKCLNCGYENYFIFDGNTILGFNTNVFIEDLVIPKYSNSDELITEVGEFAFTYKSIKSVTLPDSITKINKEAFSNCSTLETINLNEGLLTIGEYAFANNENISNLIIPNSVNTIVDYAFANCSGLHSLTLGVNLSNVNEFAFFNTNNVVEIFNLSNIDFTNQFPKMIEVKKEYSKSQIFIESGFNFYKDNNGLYYLFGVENPIDGELELPNTGFTYIINKDAFIYQNINNLYVPSYAYKILDRAFYNCGINDIYIEEGVKYIGNNVFCWNDIESAYFPSTIEYFGEGIFDGHVSNLTIPYFGKTENDLRDINYIFGGYGNDFNILHMNGNFIQDELLYGLTFNENMKLIIDESVTEIGVKAFSHSSISNLELPNSIKKIGDYAFYFSNIRDIVIPDSVEYLGEMLFYSTNNLTIPFIGRYLDDESATIDYLMEYPDGNITITKMTVIPTNFCLNNDYEFNLSIPNIITIKENSFNSSDITSIKDAYNLQIIENNAFESDYKLIEFDFSNVKYIGDYAFAGCSLTDISLREDLEYLGAYAFTNNIMTEVKLPNSIIELSDGVFKYCNSLETINLPINLTKIGNETFAYCGNLVNIELPNNIKNIGREAFANCEGNECLIIPNSVEEIGDLAFRFNGSIKELSVPFIGNNRNDEDFWAFSNVFTTLQHVKKLSITDCEIIYDNQFMYLDNLETLNLPSKLIKLGVLSIESKYFNSLIIPENVEEVEVDDSKFLVEIFNLSNVDLTGKFKNVKVIHDKIEESRIKMVDNLKFIIDFDNNYYLINYLGTNSNVILPTFDSCNEYVIMTNSFENSEVNSIIFSEGVTEIEDNAFIYCYKLYLIKLPSTLKEMGEYPFRYCFRLVEIYNNSLLDVTPFVLQYNPITIYDDWSSDSNIYFDDSGFVSKDHTIIDYIGSDKEVIVPSKINNIDCNIGYFAFMKNLNIEKVIISDEITFIGQGAFIGCLNLKYVDLPNNLTYIYADMFGNCYEIETLIIPKSITKFMDNAFWPSDIQNIYYEGIIDEWVSIQKGNNNHSVSMAKIYYYSEFQPLTEGYYWHYNENNEVVIW